MNSAKMLKYLVILVLWSSSPTWAVVKKCCSEGLSIVKGGCLEHGKLPRNVTGEYNLNCEHGMFLLDPSIDGDNFRVNDYEELVVGEGSKSGSFKVLPDSYCLGQLSRDNSLPTNKVAMACVNGEVTEKSSLYFLVKGTCAVISVIFLIITAICYITLPELRDLQGKCMMCAVISLAIGFLCLGIVQLQLVDQTDDTSCVVLGVMIYIWMLAFFFWLNVVSFNLWRSVVSRTRRYEEVQLFRCYSAYAWLCPLILCGIMLILQYGPGHKVVGHHRCFLSQDWSFVMFYLVIGVILGSNTIMFSLTCWKLWKGSENVVDTKRRSMKYKFFMYLKLFLISGLTWVFEIVSFLFETADEFWLVTDIINALQGLFIFLVLIALRPRALRALATRGFCCVKMPQRWRHKRDEELLNDDELDEDEDVNDETVRTMQDTTRNGI